MKYLQSKLKKIDGKGYKAYKDLKGLYSFQKYTLMIDYVQGDPFASPSKIRVVIPRKSTVIADEWIQSRARKVRCEDLVARFVSKQIFSNQAKVKGSGKSGMISIDAPGQEVLERTAVMINQQEVTVCLSVGLPAQGRRVLGKQAEQLFFSVLPNIISQSVFSIKKDDVNEVIMLCDQQQAIRSYMKENNHIAFVANGSILPRESGVSNRPLKGKNVVPFQSPKEKEVEIQIPHQIDPIKGMAIPKGISLIVGGGYHGKSTLLQAIERGVYDHIRDDGREFVLTDLEAYKIRAEDGRGISNVDISPFINNLPYGKSTEMFTSDNASGSTSQAANIIEGLEAGATTLLIDEDTSATNFMIRDSRMQTLVVKDKEPITPFVDKVKQLYEDYDVSTILVMGGSGDYFDIADQIIMMDQYIPHDVTNKAKAIAKELAFQREQEGGSAFGEIKSRTVLSHSLNSRKGKKNKVKVRGKNQIQYGTSDILLHDVEQLVDDSQTRMIADMMQYIEREQLLNERLTVKQLLHHLEQKAQKEGIGSFSVIPNQHPGELARPRMLEFAAALNRLRTLKIN